MSTIRTTKVGGGSMGYGVDLGRVPIIRYMEMLQKQDLLPGRRMLLEDIEARFHALEAAGVSDLAELKANLSAPCRLSALAAKTGVSEAYLTILKREMGSLTPKPVPVADFPGVSAHTIAVLLDRGIGTSKDVYDLAAARGGLSARSWEMGIEAHELQALSCLCELVRINGVGAAAARTMYEGGYSSIEQIAHAAASELLERMNAANAGNRYYKAKLGERDMRFVIAAANTILDA